MVNSRTQLQEICTASYHSTSVDSPAPPPTPPLLISFLSDDSWEDLASQNSTMCLTVFADKPTTVIVAIVHYVIITIAHPPAANNVQPVSTFLPIQISGGISEIGWSSSSPLSHINNNTNHSPSHSLFTFLFPECHSLHYLFTPQDNYTPVTEQLPFRLSPASPPVPHPSLTLVFPLGSPPSLFHSSLIASGRQVYQPCFTRGNIAIRRKSEKILIALSGGEGGGGGE